MRLGSFLLLSCLAAPAGAQFTYPARPIDSVAAGGVTLTVLAARPPFGEIIARRSATSDSVATTLTYSELAAAADSTDAMLRPPAVGRAAREIALPSRSLWISTTDGRAVDVQIGRMIVPLTAASAMRLAIAFRRTAEFGRRMAAQSESAMAAPLIGAGERVRALGGQIYFEYQVDERATLLPGNPSPRYPDLLREAGVTGEVLAQFVVGTAGHVEAGTFKVLKSTHDLFTTAVKLVLPSLRFSPARVRGEGGAAAGADAVQVSRRALARMNGQDFVRRFNSEWCTAGRYRRLRFIGSGHGRLRQLESPRGPGSRAPRCEPRASSGDGGHG